MHFSIGQCPTGYNYRKGHMLLKGTIKTVHYTQRRDNCSSECNQKDTCLSFQYSYQSKTCHLYKEAEPNVDKQREDFMFCSKIGTCLTLSLYGDVRLYTVDSRTYFSLQVCLFHLLLSSYSS